MSDKQFGLAFRPHKSGKIRCLQNINMCKMMLNYLIKKSSIRCWQSYSYRVVGPNFSFEKKNKQKMFPDSSYYKKYNGSCFMYIYVKYFKQTTDV